MKVIIGKRLLIILSVLLIVISSVAVVVIMNKGTPKIEKETADISDSQEIQSSAHRQTTQEQTSEKVTTTMPMTAAMTAETNTEGYEEYIDVSALKGKKLIAMTFDDGPFPETTNRILDVFEKYDSRCTFFVVGNRVKGFAQTIKRAISLGCEIGNHSYSHKYLTKIEFEEAKGEIDKCFNDLSEYCDYNSSLMRVPGGMYDDDILNICHAPVIQWSIDTVDWKYKKTEGEERKNRRKLTLERVLKNAEDGDIILMHDIYYYSAELAEQLVPALIEKGFTLVTVHEMFRAKGIELENGKVYSNAIVR